MYALAIGAPLEDGTPVKLRYCPISDEKTDNRLDRTTDHAAVVATCKTCGTETGAWHEDHLDGTVP